MISYIRTEIARNSSSALSARSVAINLDYKWRSVLANWPITTNLEAKVVVHGMPVL